MTGRRLILVTRPAADAVETARRLETLGYHPLLDPLLDIRWTEDPLPPFEGVQALVFTSANGVRGLARRGGTPHLPVWTVGPASAAAAREAGFQTVTAAGGDVAALADRLIRDLDPSAGAIVHAAGTVVAGDLAGRLSASGFAVRAARLYEAVPAVALAPETVAGFREERVGAALFFSPRTAGAFARLAGRAGLGGVCRRVAALCLSPACAAALRAEAGAGGVDRNAAFEWGEVRIASMPTEEALLSLLPDVAGDVGQKTAGGACRQDLRDTERTL